MQSRFTFVRKINVATKVRILSRKDRSKKDSDKPRFFIPVVYLAAIVAKAKSNI